MATQRYVSTSFWDDEWIQTLDPSEKLMYLYLMTNPLTTIAGVYKITKRRISFDTGFTLDTVGHILGKFEKVCKVYNIGEYIILPSWPKHQKWHESVKVRSGIDRVLAQLPDEVLGLLVRINYEYDISGDLLRERGIDTPSNGHTYPTDTVPVHDGYPMYTPRTTLNSDSDFNSDFNSDSDLKPEHTAAYDGSPAAASPDGGATLQQPDLGLGDERRQQDQSKPKPTVFLTFPRIGKPDTYDVTEAQADEWQALFPAVDVRQCCRAALAWLNANPKNGKSNIPRFLTSWLTREQDKAGAQRPGAQPYRRVASDRTPGYDLGRTHVFDNTRPGGEVKP